jgi:hypothetical protein
MLDEAENLSVTDRIPRLELDQLDPRVAAKLAPRIKRLGYLGEFFKCAGHQPDALLAFDNFTDALKDALPAKLSEVVALTVAGVSSNVYERHQHERLSQNLGYGLAWIAAVNRLDPTEADELEPAESAVQALAIGALRRAGGGVAAELDAVVRAIGPAAAIAVLMLIGRYATHALIVNALDLAPPVASVFAEAAL